MKKLIMTLMLFIAFSTFTFADEGDLPGGGKSCPNPALPCLVEPAPETETIFIKTVKLLIDILI